jgi:hypothetical protein
VWRRSEIFLDQPRSGALNFFGVWRRCEFFSDQPRNGVLNFFGVWRRCKFFLDIITVSRAAAL